MPLFKLRAQAADLAIAQAVSDLLAEAVVPAAAAVTLFETRPSGFAIEAYYETEPPLARINDALAVLGAGVGPAAAEALPEENWVAVSQAALPPVRARRVIVHGSHDRARFALRRTAVEIEAGEAFGTGHNATTSGCLAALDRLIAEGRRLRRVLDLGCGTGVLGIAAARLLPGACTLASDNDPVATAIARENVRLNRVASRMRILNAAGFSHPLLRAGGFDLILANILPGPLIDMAPCMRRAVRPRGVVILSGLLAEQAREIRAVYLASGFRLLRQQRLAEWTVLTLQRSGR
jgi:ribosomal protein L11 methyltransferase